MTNRRSEQFYKDMALVVSGAIVFSTGIICGSDGACVVGFILILIGVL
jgi:hypothetical protein